MKDHHTPDQIANQVYSIVAGLEHPPHPYDPIPVSLEYERWVEQPRRRGIDPVWQSLLAEALSRDDPHEIHKGAA